VGLAFVSVLLAKSLRSSTFKVALLCIATFGALVLVLFSYVYLATDAYVLTRTDREIDADRADLMAAYQKGGESGLVSAIDRLQSERARADATYLLADRSFRPVSGNLSVWPAQAEGVAGRVNLASSRGSSGVLDRPGKRLSFDTLPNGYHLLVGRDIGDLNEFMTTIHLALGFVLLLVFALAAVASVLATKRTVGRIESINATSRAIMESGLGDRVPVRGTKDEWDQLAANLNAMLDRIEVLMDEVKQVSDNVAHDLRTPLTRIRGRLETASALAREPDRDQELIADSIADLDDLLRMFTALTRISQIETSKRTAAFETVDLSEIAKSIAELFDAAAEDKGQRLECVAVGSAPVTADRDLLFDALANLVDNALKHGRDAGHVMITVTKSGGCTMLSVRDDGPGIPVDEHQNVFRRFYRLEYSRCTPGNGLGLSLVAAIARLHKAAITLRDARPGLEIQLQFPPVSR
jgi:signal transduction histidine kinase